MANNVLPLAILYIDQGRLTLITNGGQIQSVDVPSDVASEYEVLSREKLTTLIKGFVTGKEIDPSSLIMIFSSSLCFEKNFPELPTEQKEGQTQEFFDTVPFDRVLSRVYPFEKGSKAIAVNRDLYGAIYDVFIQMGFQFYAAIPAYVLTLMGYKAFDNKVAGQLLKRSDAIKQQTMILIRQPARTLQEQEEQLAREHTPLILLIFFVFIFAVVGLTFFFLNRQSKEIATPQTQVILSSPIASPLATVLPGGTSTASAVNKNELNLRLLAGTENQELAESLLVTLTQAGFTNVAIGQSQSSRAAILITVAPGLAPVLKQEIVRLVQASSPSATLRENSQEVTIVTIDMGR